MSRRLLRLINSHKEVTMGLVYDKLHGGTSASAGIAKEFISATASSAGIALQESGSALQAVV